MAATTQQRDDLRLDIGDSGSVFSDDELDRIWDRAVAAAGTSNNHALEAEARVYAIRQLMANAAKLVSYKANQSTENQSDIFKHLKDLLKYWQEEADEAVSSANAAAAWGTMRKAPARSKDIPNS